MTRRCSHCSNNGHNSRTCPTRSGGVSASASASSTTASSTSLAASGVKLFGVRLTDGSIIKKSASMGNLSAHYHGSSSAAASFNSDSPLSDHARDSPQDGYLSDDPAHASYSTNRRAERKKGTPWTEEEHRLFLIGLQKLGKGDWRGIARNYVMSRTPTQVASHAQKYFIRQSNATRRKRRSSLFDMVPDLATDPQTLPEEQELPTLQATDTDNADTIPSLDLSLKPEYEPMDAVSEEPVKKPDEAVTGSSEFTPNISRPSEFTPFVPVSSEFTPLVPGSSGFTPFVPGSNEFTPFVPGFIPAYVPVPYPFWPSHTLLPEEIKVAEASHQILKPVPILPKEPVNVDELVGMSHLSLRETERGQREPSTLSLKLIGEPSRQSAFHANAPVSGSGLGKGKGSPIKAV